MVECVTLNYILEGLAALFGSLFVASEVIGWNNSFDCRGVTELVVCSCTKTVQLAHEYTPRSSLDMVRRSMENRRRSRELQRIEENSQKV
jgi:hypothetical protein